MPTTSNGAEQFDDLVLRQARSWRERLAVDLHANTPGLSPTELTYAVQLFPSRIVFLRIREDREIARYETLKNLPVANTFDALMAELRRADRKSESHRAGDRTRVEPCPKRVGGGRITLGGVLPRPRFRIVRLLRTMVSMSTKP